MPPKASLTQAQKLEKILAYFHTSATCHTLKDLETSLPTATKIHKMQIKDLIKELTDTNQVKVEKIGSGNWYWAWAGEELAEKTSLKASLEVDCQLIVQSQQALQLQVAAVKAKQSSAELHPQYHYLLSEVNVLETDIKELIVQRDAWEDTVADGVQSKRVVAAGNRMQAIRQTENIYALEGYIRRQLPVCAEELAAIRRECYGPLYEDGNSDGIFDLEDV